MMMNMNTKPIIVAAMAASAMRHSVTNIMMTQPVSWATALIMDGRLLDRACCSVLTSFVTRLRISPCAMRLKQLMGTRLILAHRSRRICLERPSVTVAMI